jgi:hypothetical protein
MDSGWSAYLEYIKSLGGSSQFPHFPKIGRLAAPVGYICWDFLFYVVVGLSGWTIWQDPFDDFYESHLSFCRKVDTGYPLSPWLDNDKGGLATSVMSLRLPYCSARNEESKKKKKLLCFQNHACGGVLRGKDL